MKKKVYALTLILALFLSTVGSLFVGFAAANPMAFLPTITLKSDGSVEPQTTYIRQDGNIYTLTSDLMRNYAVKIQSSNIVFDGGGHVIDGSAIGGYANRGLSVESVTNVTVKNVEIRGFRDVDLSVENTTRSVFLHVKAYLHLRNSSSNTIAESALLKTLLMHGSSNNTFMRNNIYAALAPVSSISDRFFENNFFKKYEGLGSGIGWDNGSVGNYWFDYKGLDKNGDGIGDTPYVFSSVAQDRFPLMNPWDPKVPYDTVPPRITVGAPQNTAYNTSCVELVFLVCETVSWMGYSLDGQANVTVTGNATLNDLSNGAHNITVYATDVAGNAGASETSSFTVSVSWPIAPIAAAFAVFIGAGSCLFYFKRRSVIKP